MTRVLNIDLDFFLSNSGSSAPEGEHPTAA